MNVPQRQTVPAVPVAEPFALMQRVAAEARLAVVCRDGSTRLKNLHQEGAAKIRFPFSSGAGLEAVLINTAGGLTGGDRLSWSVEVGTRASAVVTTQACEKIYRAAAGEAALGVSLSVAEGARLAWLPQETILFDSGAVTRVIEADLAEDAELLLCEATIFGRTARGERVVAGRFRDRWRIRSGGRLVHAEDFSLGPDIAARLAQKAVAGGHPALASVLLVAEDAEARLEALRALIGASDGASAWRVGGTGKLLARFVAEDGYSLRRRLVPALQLLNKQAGLPKVWSL